MTAPEAAKFLGVDPKVLRTWLRKEYPRPEIEKNSRWDVQEHMLAAARIHFQG